MEDRHGLRSGLDTVDGRCRSVSRPGREVDNRIDVRIDNQFGFDDLGRTDHVLVEGGRNPQDLGFGLRFGGTVLNTLAAGFQVDRIGVLDVAHDLGRAVFTHFPLARVERHDRDALIRRDLQGGRFLFGQPVRDGDAIDALRNRWFDQRNQVRTKVVVVLRL
ncbi:hypothetical protein [Mameliella sp.]|uniref:hypothetical protein n=1 Tax=Mameliella sp. TaxID=1924940 RepID=UPI003B5065E2